LARTSFLDGSRFSRRLFVEPSSLYYYFFTIHALFCDFTFTNNNSFYETKVFHSDYFRLLFSWLPIFVCALILAKGWAGFIYPELLFFFALAFAWH